MSDKLNDKTISGDNDMSKDDSDVMLDLLMDLGFKPKRDKKSKKLTIDKSEKDERRLFTYHNTELLLKHYRTIVWVLECFPENIAEELNVPLNDIDKLLSHMDSEIMMGKKKIEKRMESLEKTRLLVERINDALTVLKMKPDDGERLYKLIYLTYIAPDKLTNAEILYRLDMSQRTYYRLRQMAITVLSIRLWSAPVREVDLWIDMLTILEKMA